MPPLAHADAHQLLRERFGDDPSLDFASRNIIERAQGNPFFLEELVSTMVERGDFDGERGAYRLKGGTDIIPLPATVQAVVAARIDHLEDIAKHVLEVAAVIGRLVAMAVLKPVSALPNDELLEAITQLRQAELLYDLPPFDQGLLAFRHPLIQEVSYAMQLRPGGHAACSRREGDDRTLSPGATQLDQVAGLLAYHYEAAGQTLEAVNHQQRARPDGLARRILPRHSRAGKRPDRCCSICPGPSTMTGCELFRAARILKFRLARGHIGRRGKALRGGGTLLRTLGGPDERADTAWRVRANLAATAAADDYVRLAQDAVKLTSGEGDVGRFATANAMLSQAFLMAGQLDEILECGSRGAGRHC